MWLTFFIIPQKLLTGFKLEEFPDTRCIDVRDVAEAHILAAVTPEAKVGVFPVLSVHMHEEP